VTVVESLESERRHSGYFFFQAEDGIRDFHVTGVQTCALPISWGSGRKRPPSVRCPSVTNGLLLRLRSRTRSPALSVPRFRRTAQIGKRRVGKEWRSRWAPAHE